MTCVVRLNDASAEDQVGTHVHVHRGLRHLLAEYVDKAEENQHRCSESQRRCGESQRLPAAAIETGVGQPDPIVGGRAPRPGERR